jgi:excisionase family DNA binding protein
LAGRGSERELLDERNNRYIGSEESSRMKSVEKVFKTALPAMPGEAGRVQPRCGHDADNDRSARWLLRPMEVARLLAIGKTKAYKMIAAGELPVVKIGTAVRVPRDRLVEWIARNTSSRAS